MSDPVKRIEQLEAQHKHFAELWEDERKRLDKMANDAFKAVAHLGAENAKLREALDKTKETVFIAMKGSTEYAHAAGIVYEIASTALEEKE